MLSFSKAPSRKEMGDLPRTGTGMGKKRVVGGLLELQLHEGLKRRMAANCSL